MRHFVILSMGRYHPYAGEWLYHAGFTAKGHLRRTSVLDDSIRYPAGSLRAANVERHIRSLGYETRREPVEKTHAPIS